MVPGNRQRVFVAAVICLVGQGGCQAVSRGKHCPRPEEGSTRPAVVDVGGDVNQPGRIEILADGLTLRRALALAGGLRENRIARDSAPDSLSPAVLETFETLQEKYQLAGGLGAKESIIHIAAARQRREPTAQETTELRTLQERRTAIEGETRKLQAAILAQAPGYDEFLRELASATTNLANRRATLEALTAGADLDQSAELLNEDIRRFQTQVDNLGRQLVATSPTDVFRPEARTYLVALQRPSLDPPVTFFFPYEMAIAGQIGEIGLSSGDLVQVLDYRRTSLDPANVAPPLLAGTFDFGGLVDNPGTKTIDGQNNNFKKALARAEPRIANDPLGALTVTRQGTTGLGSDSFVLPLPAVNAGPLGTSPVLNGDQLTYTRVPLVPIVLRSLAKAALNGSSQDEPAPDDGTLLERHRERRDERLDQRIGRSGDVIGQMLKNRREARQVFRNRLGL